MLSIPTKRLLCELLIEIGDEEQNLEVLRQILCEQINFEPYVAFKRIDFKRKSYINSIDIKEFLSINGINQSEKSCQYYISHYDTNKDGKLIYPE